MVNLYGIGYNPYIGNNGILKIIQKDLDRIKEKENEKEKQRQRQTIDNENKNLKLETIT
jgi:hypothetical protein